LFIACNFIAWKVHIEIACNLKILSVVLLLVSVFTSSFTKQCNLSYKLKLLLMYNDYTLLFHG